MNGPAIGLSLLIAVAMGCGVVGATRGKAAYVFNVPWCGKMEIPGFLITLTIACAINVTGMMLGGIYENGMPKPSAVVFWIPAAVMIVSAVTAIPCSLAYWAGTFFRRK